MKVDNVDVINVNINIKPKILSFSAIWYISSFFQNKMKNNEKIRKKENDMFTTAFKTYFRVFLMVMVK